MINNFEFVLGDPNEHLINLVHTYSTLFFPFNSLIEVEKMQSVTYSPQPQLARDIDENLSRIYIWMQLNEILFCLPTPIQGCIQVFK